MLISKKWLHDFVFLPDALDPEELAKTLTLHTVEVEGWYAQDELLDGVVVGEVRSIKKHDNADKLKVCNVFDGTDEVQIVCGGSNLKKGMKVALGTIGAKVKWHGEGEPVELKKTKIRGEVSMGMICAAEEIGLADMYPAKKETEILDLSDLDSLPGTPLNEALKLDDVIIDIDNKSMTHRPDLWGHYGLARELSAIYHKKFKSIKPAPIKQGSEMNIKVAVDSEACHRYQAVVLKDVHVEPSPKWLQERLLSVGLTPINNIVDVTNYIMYELGQPLHAFDLDKLDHDDKTIHLTVRDAKQGETITTLDGHERILDAKTLVIADQTQPIAIAGIMGGKQSEVGKKTTNVLIECANFDAVRIRRTSQMLGLRTDASTRFEKTLDPHLTQMALRRCVAMIRTLSQDTTIMSNVTDSHTPDDAGQTIIISVAYILQKIGQEISKKEIVSILERLGFAVKSKKDTLFVDVPTWRSGKDISIPDDLVEEVARLYGYDMIKTDMPQVAMSPAQKNPLEQLQEDLRDLLSKQAGFTEVMNYSFVDPKYLEGMGISEEERLQLDKPIAKDRPYLRRHLSTNLLETVNKNTRNTEELAIFELGKVFIPEEVGERATVNSDELLPKQSTMLGLAYSNKRMEVPFAEVSGAVKSTCDQLGYDVTLAPRQLVSFAHPGRTAEVLIGSISVGWIAEVHPHIAQRLGLDYRVALAEINLDTLLNTAPVIQRYEEIPVYPDITRDIAFEVSTGVLHAEIYQKLISFHDLISHVELLDVYEGEQVPKGKKSMTYRIVYRSEKKTLKTDEVDTLQQEVIGMMKKTFSVSIR